MLTPEERSLRARLAAHVMHASHDAHDTTDNARKAFQDSFEAEVDPEGTLAPEERRWRAAHARKAHYARMAFESAKARRKCAKAKLDRQASKEPPVTAALVEVA